MPEVTLILHNSNILTMDANAPRAEAIAVGADGRILAIGRDSEVRNLHTAGTRAIDLRGQTLLPGFFDCHLHIMWLGLNLGNVNLASPPVRNKHDIVQLLRQRLDVQPETPCVQGNRYDQNKLEGGNHLSRHDLDAVSTTTPVRIAHTSGHAAVVNTVALQRLGITRDTPDPVGGEIGRDASGEPNGILLETASWNNLERLIPEPTPEVAIAALERASGYLLERGITSATDANTPPHAIDAYYRAVVTNRLRPRVNCMVNWAEIMEGVGDETAPTPDALQPASEAVNWHRLHVGQAKLFSDGAITTRTCWLREPFLGMPYNFGIPLHPPDELTHLILTAHNAGWQIATHAIGDRANDLVLTAYAEAQRQNTRHRPRHRIEHAMLLDADLIARFRRQNVWAIGQPEFLSTLGDAYLSALGEERANRLSPYATLEAQNVAQAFSSDCPVVPGSPLAGIRAALERRTPQGAILNAEECLAPEAALYAYTAAPAYASRVERDRGTLEIGKWADFTLLSADPLSMPLDEWESLRMMATFVGGECLYGMDAVSK